MQVPVSLRTAGKTPRKQPAHNYIRRPKIVKRRRGPQRDIWGDKLKIRKVGKSQRTRRMGPLKQQFNCRS